MSRVSERYTKTCTDTPSADRAALRQRINDDVAAFLAAGGKVADVPQGATGLKGVLTPQDQNDLNWKKRAEERKHAMQNP